MLLSLAIWIPIVAGLVVLAAGGDRRAQLQRWIALAGALLGFLVTIPLYTGFDVQSAGFQFEERLLWIGRSSIYNHLGAAGFSLLLLFLTTFFTLLGGGAGWPRVESRVGRYTASSLFLPGLLNGVFS